MKHFNLIFTVLLSALLFFSSCEKKERDFTFLQGKLIEAGYDHRYEKPSGSLQMAALNMFGIDDLLAYKGEANSFVIIRFKDTNEEKMKEKIETIFTFIEAYIRDEDRQQLEDSRENINKQSFIHNDIVLVWEKEKPDGVDRIIRRYF
jgi:hypothetical protein